MCGFNVNSKIPIVDKSQVVQCVKDRKATNKFIENIDYVYKYSLEVGVDPSIVIAISCLETGYGHSNLFINYNNPGGIKSTYGWRRFDNIKDGYKYMINLLATYSGLRNKSSRLYGKAKTTQELGNYYWVENGTDRGYHRQLTTMIKTMQSYPVKKEANNPVKKTVTQKLLDMVKNNKPSDIIYKILNRKEEDNPMDLIRESLNKR